MNVISRPLSVRISLPVPVMITSAGWPPGRGSFTQNVRFPLYEYTVPCLMKTFPEKSTSTRLFPSEWKIWGRRGGRVFEPAASAEAAGAPAASIPADGILNLLVSDFLLSDFAWGGAPSAMSTSLTGPTSLPGTSVDSGDGPGPFSSLFLNSAVSSRRDLPAGATGRDFDRTPAASLSSTRRTMS